MERCVSDIRVRSFESLSPIANSYKNDGIHRCAGGAGVNFSPRKVKPIDVFHVQINESRIRRAGTSGRVTPVDPTAFIGASASGRHELVSGRL